MLIEPEDMLDNPTSFRSPRNSCDIIFIRENFRFREKKPESWKFFSFILLVGVFFLVNLKIRIHGARLKLSRQYIDSFIHGYSEKELRSCPAPQYENRSKSVYCLFRTLSREFHRRSKADESGKEHEDILHGSTEDAEFADEMPPERRTGRPKDSLHGSTEDAEFADEKPPERRTGRPKTLGKAEDPIRCILLPCLIIGPLAALTLRAMWDVAKSDDLTKKKPSITSVSRRPSLRQNMLRKMSETSLSGPRRPSYARQQSQPELKRRLSITKEALYSPTILARQYSAPAHLAPDFRRGFALDYSSCEDDQTTPESKRRVRMIRRY